MDASVQGFDPSELICPSCQPSSVEDCRVHGKDWLAYKCRYCCSFANWYCVAEGSRINLGNGTSLPIEEMQHLPSIHTFDSTRGGVGMGSTVRHIDQSDKDCVELTLSDGRTLQLTSDHKVMTLNGMIATADLQPGVSVLLAGPDAPVDVSDGDEANFSLTLPALGHMDMRTRAGRDEMLAFARLLGLWLSEKRASVRDGGVVSVVMQHGLDVEALQQDLVLLTGLPGLVTSTLSVELSAALVQDLLSVSGGDAQGMGMTLPAFVTASDCPRALVRELLGALFGGHGRAPSLHSGHSHLQPLTFSSSSVSVLAQVQSLMARFHIPTSAWSVREGEESEMSLSRHEVARFSDCVGFRYSCRQQMRLTAAAAFSRLHMAVARQRQWMAHRVKQLITQFSITVEPAAAQAEKELRYDDVVVHDSSIVTASQLHEWLQQDDVEGAECCPANLDTRTFLDSIDASQWFVEEDGVKGEKTLTVSAAQCPSSALPPMRLRLLDRRSVGVKRVYDLSVPSTHNFLANGVVVSNW